MSDDMQKLRDAGVAPTLGEILDGMDNDRAVIGGNNPPEPTPLEAHTANIDDLYEEAHNWLDGTPIENQGQADEVTRLLDLAKKAGKAADTQRAAEKKPHDDAAKVVQAAWKPLVDKASRVETGTKAAIGKWLVKVQEAQRAAAAEANRVAEAIAAKARAEHMAAAQSGNLSAIEDAEQGIKDAKAAEREAVRADKAKPAAKVEGMTRGVGLTTVWDVALSGEDGDAQALARHFWQTKRAEVMEFYMGLARTDVRLGARVIPGTVITSRQVAR